MLAKGHHPNTCTLLQGSLLLEHETMVYNSVQGLEQALVPAFVAHPVFWPS